MKTMENTEVQQYRWKLESGRHDALRLLDGLASETQALEMLILHKTPATNPSAASQRSPCSSKPASAEDWFERLKPRSGELLRAPTAYVSPVPMIFRARDWRHCLGPIVVCVVRK